MMKIWRLIRIETDSYGSKESWKKKKNTLVNYNKKIRIISKEIQKQTLEYKIFDIFYFLLLLIMGFQ